MSIIIASSDKATTSRAKRKRARRNGPRRNGSRRNGGKTAKRIRLFDPVAPSSYFRWKRLPDTMLAGLLLVPALPIIAALILFVRLASRGPGLYRQSRIGKDGRHFKLYKIRTMRHDAEARTGAVWSGPGDARVTGLGVLLRRFHLDELPQLFNVLKGEMSLVGPRPERPEFVRALSGAIPGYKNRLCIRPGITGLAQLNLPPDADLCCVCRKVAVDMDYIEHAGLLLDLRVLLCTCARLFKLPNAVTLAPLSLTREVRMENCYRRSGNGKPRAKTAVKSCPAWERFAELMGTLPVAVPAATAAPPETHARPLRIEPAAASADAGNGSNGSAEAVVNAFTVDVEDYYMVSGFEEHISRAQWGEFESRVVPNTKRILRLLEAHDVKATFFVLGWVAQHYPELVREIHAAGHEIGSHGYWHHMVYRQTPDEFRDDLRVSRDVIEAAIDQPIEIYRAPSFSITEKSRWALDILTEEGFRIDSSIYPIHHDRYGIADAEPGLHRIATPTGPLWEFPPSVVSWKGVNIPVGGGGYFRLYPLPLTIRWLRQINRDGRRPFLSYVHPWEIDPDQPRIHEGSPLSRLRHYVNLSQTERRIEALLEHFHFAPIGHIVPREWDSPVEKGPDRIDAGRPADRTPPSSPSIAPATSYDTSE
ncbi:MAG: sugar transferase [Planctomycetia bacterium]|nr:sugar transferase [Planctomycetia bacterium]